MWMHHLLWIALSALLMDSPVSLARFSYPTQWYFENKTKDKLYLECKTDNPQGLSHPLFFASTRPILPHENTIQAWHGIHNDGLGLNPGTWTCAVGKRYAPLTLNPALSKVEFHTRWAEEVKLRAEVVDGAILLSQE